MRIAFFGSSLVSAYWNGACTYYRGIIRALDELGHSVTFHEPDAWDRQAHRDLHDPDWATVRVYEPVDERAVRAAVADARHSDVIVKCSGVGAYDDVLADAVAALDGPSLRIFWDVDAPATLAAIEAGRAESLRTCLDAFELVLTYGGGEPVVDRYRALGVDECVPVYNAVELTVHHPVAADPARACDLLFVGNRLPDRETRVQRFLFDAARRSPGRRFTLGGSGWSDDDGPPNVWRLGHVSPADHNVLNCSARAVLNLTRDAMAANGFSPATRLFEAAGAGACLITDPWAGLERFLEPGREVLVAADGEALALLLDGLGPARARRIGDAARRRVLAEHTYRHRAAQVQSLLDARLGVRS